MDPNATLAELRRLVAIVDRPTPHFTAIEERLATLVSALDESLSKGGALPDAWTTKHAENYGAGFITTYSMFNDPNVCGDCGGPIDGPHPLCDRRSTKV